MPGSIRDKWADRLDRFCAISGAGIPAGLVIGKVVFEGCIGLVVIGWIARCVLARENPFKTVLSHPLILPWIVWLVCIAVSLVVNGAGSKGWAHDFVFIRFLLYIFALLDISQRLPVIRYLIWGLAIGVIWSLINMLSAHLFGHDLLGKPLSRYILKRKEAGRISAIAAFAAPFFLAEGFLDKQLKKKMKWCFILLGFLAFFLLFPTRGRTTVIAATAGLFFTLFIFMRGRISKSSAWGIALAVIFMVISLGFFLQERKVTDLGNLYDRIYYWKVSWAVWQDHMIFGVGVSSFQDAYREMAATGLIKPFVAPDGRIFNLGEVTHAHNLVLMLLSSTGIMGLCAFIWVFAAVVRCLSASRSNIGPGLVTWPFVFLVIGLTGFNIFDSEYLALQAFFMAMIGTNLIYVTEAGKDILAREKIRNRRIHMRR